MKKKTVFIVITGSQNPLVNKLMEAAGFCDGVYLNDGSGFKMTITWTKEKRIEEAKKLIKKVLQENNIIVQNIYVEE
jgi:hypothetical protein